MRTQPHSPVLGAASGVLAHVPGLVAHGSKPARELRRGAITLAALRRSLRTLAEALSYPPHQAYVGAVHPRRLPPRPWVGQASTTPGNPHGSAIMGEAAFLGLMAAVDDFNLITLRPSIAERAHEELRGDPLFGGLDLDRLVGAAGDVERAARDEGSLVVAPEGEAVAVVRRAHEEDEALGASVLLENLANKATGVLAVLHLLRQGTTDPESVDYVIGCAEEAVGDRYQRGGGNMAKAVAAAAGLTHASGADVKNFCAAPVPALVVAASLVASGVFSRVVVVGGGSLAKLGMKFQGHLKHGLPVLEDVIGGSAALVQRDDGRSPRIRLDVVGRHRVIDGASTPQIMEALAFRPLDSVGLKSTDIDDFATELHNPEITEPQGSGNVPDRNYRTLAALAARRKEISRDEIDAFVNERGMPGFAPTQGHLASAMCYLLHAIRRLTADRAQRVMLLSKGSLFLGRMTELSDGMSVLLERNDTDRTREPVR